MIFSREVIFLSHLIHFSFLVISLKLSFMTCSSPAEEILEKKRGSLYTIFSSETIFLDLQTHFSFFNIFFYVFLRFVHPQLKRSSGTKN